MKSEKEPVIEHVSPIIISGADRRRDRADNCLRTYRSLRNEAGSSPHARLDAVLHDLCASALTAFEDGPQS